MIRYTRFYEVQLAPEFGGGTELINMDYVTAIEQSANNTTTIYFAPGTRASRYIVAALPYDELAEALGVR